MTASLAAAGHANMRSTTTILPPNSAMRCNIRLEPEHAWHTTKRLHLPAPTHLRGHTTTGGSLSTARPLLLGGTLPLPVLQAYHLLAWSRLSLRHAMAIGAERLSLTVKRQSALFALACSISRRLMGGHKVEPSCY